MPTHAHKILKIAPFQHQLASTLSKELRISKILAQVLKEHPLFNASLVDNEVILWDDINIGVAVDIEQIEDGAGGLIVPVVPNADKKSLAEIHHLIKDLSERARNRKLLPADYADHTFTLSNTGVFGISSGFGTPILNQPEVGLLMTRPIAEKVVPVEGQIVIRPMMDYSLTYDHRVITGGDATRFRALFERLTTNPYLLMLY